MSTNTRSVTVCILCCPCSRTGEAGPRQPDQDPAGRDGPAGRADRQAEQGEEGHGRAAEKTLEDLQAEEDKVNHLSKLKTKLEQTLDEVRVKREVIKRYACYVFVVLRLKCFFFFFVFSVKSL